MKHAPFRPHSAIAAKFYDLIYSIRTWEDALYYGKLCDEVNAIRGATFPPITVEDVKRVEIQALGHTDYAAVFARALRDLAEGA